MFMPAATSSLEALSIRTGICAWLDERARATGGPQTAVRPAHRIRLQWPPHPISADYHVVGSDWSVAIPVTIEGDAFTIRLARRPYGVFARLEGVWNEVRAQTDQEAIATVIAEAEPFFTRQRLIGQAIGLEGRYTGSVRDLAPLELLKLLFCPDRDIAAEAQTLIETHASLHLLGPSLVHILKDRSHAQRRSAQWCVLDLFEDLPSFCPDPQEAGEAIHAIQALMWDAEDDYARSVYKAGVVLGGHVCDDPAAAALFHCFHAPSRIGRRSAYHASFHLAEWRPDLRSQVLERLRQAALTDPEPLLAIFADKLADDVDRGEVDHVMEPMFPDEP